MKKDETLKSFVERFNLYGAADYISKYKHIFRFTLEEMRKYGLKNIIDRKYITAYEKRVNKEVFGDEEGISFKPF
jgi:hypothetical protein